MKNRIIAIGPLSDLKNKRFTGQSVMFDGTVDFFRKSGLDVTVVDINQSVLNGSVIRRCLDYFTIFAKFFWTCISKRFDVAYLTSSLGKTGIYRDMIFVGVLHLFHVKVVIHQFGADISGTSSIKGLSKKIFNRILRYISYILVEGDYIKQLFEKIPEVSGKIKIVPNGLPLEGKHIGKNKEYNINSPFLLFYLSNLIYSKGWFDVLQSVNLLVNEYHLDVKCVFAGRFLDSLDDEKPGISSKQVFDDYVATHNLKEYIEYYVGLYGEEKDEYFSRANVFLLPTYYINEGQPVSIIEAMAYGCVPIVTNYRHIPMMVNESNGIYVEPRSPESIASAISSLIQNPQIYREKSKACIEDYQMNFTFAVYTSKIMDYIKSLL